MRSTKTRAKNAAKKSTAKKVAARKNAVRANAKRSAKRTPRKVAKAAPKRAMRTIAVLPFEGDHFTADEIERAWDAILR